MLQLFLSILWRIVELFGKDQEVWCRRSRVAGAGDTFHMFFMIVPHFFLSTSTVLLALSLLPIILFNLALLSNKMLR